MAISREVMNQMVQTLRQERLNSEFYNEIEKLMQEVLLEIGQKHNIPLNELNFFIAGDHMLNTNILNASPLIIFVSIKQKREEVLLHQKAQKANKRLKKYIAPTFVLTDEFLATELFHHLKLQLDTTDKLFASKNILMLNLANTIKVKIIVGYYFDDNFEYEYLGSFYEENLLQLIEAFDQKETKTKNFYDLIRILKSMELELFDLGYIKQKTYDNLYFTEHLIYNVPNELLIGDDMYDVFIKTINYLKNENIENFTLVDKNKLMFDKSTQYNLAKAKYFIKIIENFFLYFDKVIESFNGNNKISE